VHTIDTKRKLVSAFLALLLLPGLELKAADDQKTDNKALGAAVISKYLQATQNHEHELRGVSMQVDISATVPKLKEKGSLRALRQISKVGQITYRVLGFQGDNTVKSQVIARYLEAEKQGQGKGQLDITPANYKFKFKGKWQFDGKDAYLFQLNPRKKRVGLFKGELWLDSATYLPIYEKGRLVKNPSIFFKRVVFERAFTIENGVAVPRYMVSAIETRVIGKVEITINYSNLEQNAGPDGGQAQSAALPGAAK
jgi:transglutaminase-like putative cysteine protease